MPHAGPHENTINHITHLGNRESTEYYWTPFIDTETTFQLMITPSSSNQNFTTVLLYLKLEQT